MLRSVFNSSVVPPIFFVLAVITYSYYSLVQAQDVPEQMTSAASMQPIYEAVCAACHDDPSDDIIAPSREALSHMEPEQVLAALKDGPMVVYTSEFREDELRAMAELVTGKQLGNSLDRTVYPTRMVGAFENGCAVCHDNSPVGRPISGGTAAENMPSRFDIQRMGSDELLTVLNRPIKAHD